MSLEQLTPESNIQPAPDIKFMNRLAELETKKKNIEEKISEADIDEKMFLEAELTETTKQIQSYHESFGQYRKKTKRTALEDMAGKDKVEEVDKFKFDSRNKVDDLGLSDKFLEDFNNFKKGRRDDITKH